MSVFVLFVGIDLGNTQQAVCVLDGDRKEVLRRVVDTNAVSRLLLEAIGDVKPERVAVAVEDCNNVVVDALLDLGFAIFSINPKQADRFRDRLTAAGAKDDRRDALVLARSLVTDMELFRRRAPLTSLEAQLRSLRRRETLLAEETRRVSNQLYAAVQRLDPSLLRLCEGADEAWFWSLLLSVTTTKRLSSKGVEALLKKAGKRKLDVLVPRVMAVLSRDRPRAGTAIHRWLVAEVRSLVTVLRTLDSEHANVEKLLIEVIAECTATTDEVDGKAVPSTVSILLSMPGIGPKTAATLVGDALPLLRRDQVGLLRAVTGVAPVTKQSGKSRSVSMRYACNTRLRNALFHAAHAASCSDESFGRYCQKLLDAGHSRARALRSVADRMLRILVAMVSSRTLYDETRGRAATSAA